MLLPLWVLIERRSRAPMLDLTLFRNRLFAAASAAAFINGLARFALMFLFVFYFQGAAGRLPDRRRHQAGRRSRSACSSPPRSPGSTPTGTAPAALAAIGMLVTATGWPA